MPEEDSVTNGVRITNREIYDLLVRVDGRVAHVESAMKENIRPRLSAVETALTSKADKETVQEARGRIATLEMRVYAIISGLVAAVLGLNAFGVI